MCSRASKMSFRVILVFLCFEAGVFVTRGQRLDHGYKAYSREFTIQKAVEDKSAYKFLCLVVGVCVTGSYSQNSKFMRVLDWRQLEFDYPTPHARENDISSGAFIPGKPAPIDIDVFYSSRRENKMFTTIPRFQKGVPATLGTVQRPTASETPLIKPYPSWKWHQNPELCKHDRIVSVYRVKIDRCDRLWVLDTGRLVTTQVCPPQILAFDLNTDQLIHRYEIPSDQLESRSILVTPVIDIQDTCEDTFVYVADCQTYSIIVHDARRHTSWQVTDKTMFPYPNYGTFRIQGDEFDLMDGILGMDISPYVPGQDRKLFYHAMSSPTENWVYTSHLKNQSLFEHDPMSSPGIFHTYSSTRGSQSAAEAIDKNGIAYFGQMTETTINCWNTATEYGARNIDIVEYNPTTLQFASGVKVVNNRKGSQELWVITTRFQKIGSGTLDPTEVNFRVQAVKIDDALRGTKCKSASIRPPYYTGGSGSGSCRLCDIGTEDEAKSGYSMGFAFLPLQLLAVLTTQI